MKRRLELWELWPCPRLQNSSLGTIIQGLVSYFLYGEITFKPRAFGLLDMITLNYFKAELIILTAIYSFTPNQPRRLY